MDYDCVCRGFRTESIRKCTFTKIKSRREATQRIVTGKLTRLAHKIVLQLSLLVESCTICSSSSRRSVRELLDTHSYMIKCTGFGIKIYQTHNDLGGRTRSMYEKKTKIKSGCFVKL